MIAAKQELQLCDVEVSKSVELLHGSIKTREGKRMTLVAYYRPPNRTDNQYLQDTSQEFQRLKQKSGKSILMIAGDFNLPDIDWQSLSTKSNHYPERVNKTFLDIIADTDLEQQVDFPTRKDHNTLDLVLTTHPSFKVRCKPLPSIGNSDHDIVLYDTALSPQRPKPTRRKIYLWKKADIRSMKQDVLNFNNTYQRPDPTTPNAVEQMWIAIRDLLTDIVEKHVPAKTTAARYSNPWINTSIRRAIRRKQRAHRKARKTGKKRDKDRYKRLQAETRYEIRQAYRSYMDEISQDLKTNSKRFWSFVKSRRQESIGVAPLKDKNGFLKSDSQSKAEILGDQFQSVFTEEDTTSVPDKGTSPFPDMPPITVNAAGLRKLLQNLNPHKATGPDNIPAFVLKNTAPELAPLLSELFQLSLDTQEVPEDWKKANVVPIFKKGDRSLPANYRPVSLTSIMCKILEHVVHSSIMNHFDNHSILSDAQHGFRKSRSCETQLLVTTHDFAKTLSDRKQVDVVLLDFSKAFDKVPHQRLMSKLHYYGVRNNTLGWIKAFLSGRTQQVVVEGVHSSPACVLSGVPQGTVLGPLLFLSYINDLPEVVTSCHTRLFADDALLYRTINNSLDQTKLQEDLNCLAKWEHTWQMDFNPSKCTTLRMSANKRLSISSSYVLHGETLENVTSAKYLGVTLSDDLSWSKHVEAVAAKGNSTVGFLRRNFRECSNEVRKATYTTMVRPVLEYASSVWDPHQKEDIDRLEKVQKRAARYACNNYFERTPGTITSMLQQLKWNSLEQRRRHNRLGMLYRIENGLVDLQPSTFYRHSDSRTRGGNKIYQEHAAHRTTHNAFFARTISEWNKLPSAITSASSLNVFLQRLTAVDQQSDSATY